MICANPKCGKEFERDKFNPKQKYCSKACRDKARNEMVRIKYHDSDEFRARLKRNVKRWRQKENGRESGRRAVRKYHSTTLGRAGCSARELRYIELLSDRYIKKKWRRQGVNNPSAELIEEKRLTIQLKRKIHEVQRAIKPSGDHGRSHGLLS